MLSIIRYFIFLFIIIVLSIILSGGCKSEDSSDSAEGDITFYKVGGSITGLNGSVVLQVNNTGDLILSSDGPFEFTTTVQEGLNYSFTVKTHPGTPNHQLCAVIGGSGPIAGDVSDIQVN